MSEEERKRKVGDGFVVGLNLWGMTSGCLKPGAGVIGLAQHFHEAEFTLLVNECPLAV
jgi:hypothetical protein